jgi:hypothetical protein
MGINHRWLLRFVGFLVVIIAGDALSWGLGAKYFTPLSHRRTLKVWTYQQEGLEADILYLGTSKIRSAVIPQEIDEELSTALGRDVNSFCLAQQGSSCFANWMLLRDVVASNGEPSVIVLELSAQSVNANHGNLARGIQYFAETPDLIRSIPWLDSGKRRRAASAVPFRGITNLVALGMRPIYENDLRRVLNRVSRGRGAQYFPGSAKAYERISDLSSAERTIALQNAVTIGRSSPMTRYEVGGAPGWAFDSICRFARSRSIPLVVFDTPNVKDIEGSLVIRSEADQFHRFVEGYSDRPGIQWLTVDAETLNLTDSDFRDFTHLHPDGATKFSRYLAAEVLLPLLRDQAEF